MNVELLFLDLATSKNYNHDSLEHDSLGGTEATTIRLAEGFGASGTKTVVINGYATSGQESPNGVLYAPVTWLSQMKPKTVVHLRYLNGIDSFKSAKQFIWFHDRAAQDHNNISNWPERMKSLNVIGIAVSDWHVQNLLSIAPELPVMRLYSPVDELCYAYPRPDTVDINQLVWMSSPHKGLEDGIILFNLIRQEIPELKLVVFNPGYLQSRTPNIPGVKFIPQCDRSTMRKIVSNSLALFYPTAFEETFGLITAEANALGTPALVYPVAALTESCGNEFCQDPLDLKTRLISWRRERPAVTGQDRFRLNNVLAEWRRALGL